jgi:hypothetical protein
MDCIPPVAGEVMGLDDSASSKFESHDICIVEIGLSQKSAKNFWNGQKREWGL